jgi:sigma-B regulation protein RsbU (phosphoserine phosphatase)
VFYASITNDGRLTYANAGHLPPLLVGRSGSRRWLDKGGTVVGLFEGTAFDQETVQMQDGDRLVVFSDGVTEAVDRTGAEFGDDRLAECADKCADLPPAEQVTRIIEAVQQFATGVPQADDITALVLSYSPGRSHS